MLPALYISHGGPTFVVSDLPSKTFLEDLGRELPRPKSVLLISAHWETDIPQVTSSPKPPTIHDFYGFPEEFYRMQYPAPGAPELAERAVGLLNGAGLSAAPDPVRGLDHGAWETMMLMYPKADMPVAQLSIQFPLGPAHHVTVGRALRPLREENVLVLASGTAMHNLRLRAPDTSTPPNWATEFESWLIDAVEKGDEEELVDYRRRAPHAVLAHPRDEHFLPLFVAYGAGGGKPGRTIHRSYAYGIMSMAAFAFE